MIKTGIALIESCEQMKSIETRKKLE